ncbi:hypothetical protein [Candidatus Xenohaliotis californiensis]|uniref:hypothetical protein n=1 Tax=Candidatus Xenohaliotis californiensis TaxID=84677 RepID=UPI0030C88A8E
MSSGNKAYEMLELKLALIDDKLILVVLLLKVEESLTIEMMMSRFFKLFTTTISTNISNDLII